MIPFSVEAKHHFDKVAMAHGLSSVVADDQRVRYESSLIFLNVNFDNGRSFELGVEIGQKIPGMIERPFSLAEILRLRNSPEASIVDGLSASTVPKLAAELHFLAEITLNYARDFLNGSDLSFAQVAKLREKESIAYAIQRDLRSARARADKAWVEKNFADVVVALEPVKSHLSPSELKRLEISANKVRA